MPSYAKIEIVGHASGEAFLGRTKSADKPFARFSVAVNNPKNKNDTQWFNVFVYNEVALNQAKAVKKGSTVIVRGLPRPDKYEKNGETVPQIVIWANEVYVAQWYKKDESARHDELPF